MGNLKLTILSLQQYLIFKLYTVVFFFLIPEVLFELIFFTRRSVYNKTILNKCH